MTLEIANRLVQLRKDNGLSQEDLAEKLSVSRQAISKWERAESSPDTDNLIALAKLYNVSLDDLLSGSSSGTPLQPGDPEDPLPEGSYFDHKKDKQRQALNGLYPMIIAGIYLVLGCLFNLWHPGWLLFLTIPLFYLPESHRTPLRLLGNPVMVTIIYLLLGFMCDLWHPGWLVFLLIPVLNAIAR